MPKQPTRNMTVEQRFWFYAGAHSDDGCWEWTGAKITVGYGTLAVGKGKTVYAHRYSYELLNRQIPDGLTIDHLCRNRLCVNPSHLEAVTLAENKRRGMSLNAQNARKTHCQRGREFTPENTSLSRRGHRECRACRITVLRPRELARKRDANKHRRDSA